VLPSSHRRSKNRHHSVIKIPATSSADRQGRIPSPQFLRIGTTHARCAPPRNGPKASSAHSHRLAVFCHRRAWPPPVCRGRGRRCIPPPVCPRPRRKRQVSREPRAARAAPRVRVRPSPQLSRARDRPKRHFRAASRGRFSWPFFFFILKFFFLGAANPRASGPSPLMRCRPR